MPARNREKFYMLYDSMFNEALNTKRSLYEQTVGRIVRESIAQLENPGDFFTMEELCKLRRATTERERLVLWNVHGHCQRKKELGKAEVQTIGFDCKRARWSKQACHKEQ